MKKVICVLACLAALCSGLFAESIIKQIDIKDVPDFIESADFNDRDSYTFQIIDNFKPEDVTVKELRTLSYLISLSHNKIEGPIECIYFGGTQSAEVFYELRQKIDNAKGKYVFVDISDSDYYFNYPLPKNTFADHENLYWVNFGSFAGRDIPANTCKDCKNLQFVMMWNYEKVDDTAFSGANESAKIYDRDNNESPLALIHQIKTEEYDDWDYLTFTDEEPFEEDDDEYASYEGLFEDLVNYFYEESMKELDFSDLFGDVCLQISASNA